MFSTVIIRTLQIKNIMKNQLYTNTSKNYRWLFVTVSLNPLSFFANTPFNNTNVLTSVHVILKINSEICSNTQIDNINYKLPTSYDNTDQLHK